MFSHLSVSNVNLFFLHRSLLTHSNSPIPPSLIPVVTSSIHEFRDLPFLRLAYYYYYYWLYSLLASQWTYGIYVFLPYVRLINCRFHLFRFSASSFSSQCLLLFLKSSRSCVLLLLPTHFTSVICPPMASWRRQFLLRIWAIQLTFFYLGYYLEVSSSPL